MKYLKQIRIRDYRSFIDEVVVLGDDICTIVGANEGGKTNVLDAIAHIDQSISFQSDDLRKGAKNYPNGNIEIEFDITLSKKLLPKLIKEVPSLEGRTFRIIKSGKNNGQDPVLTYSLIDRTGLEKIVEVKKPKALKEQADEVSLKLFQDDLGRKWFIKKESVNLTKSPFPQLKKAKALKTYLTDEAVSAFLEPVIFSETQENIKVYRWAYDKEDFLKSSIPLAEFVADPNAFPTTRNLFRVAGWTDTDIVNSFPSLKHTDLLNKLSAVEEAVNKLIHKTWKQHKDLKIDIQCPNDILSIHLRDSELTPPEIRSDGLKWFLSFLINFHAQSETLSEHIVLIDEPALHLHPRGQKDVLAEIIGLSSKNQMVYTTHLTFMLDKNHPERIRVLNRKSVKNEGREYYVSVVKNELTDSDIISDPLLREVLGYRVSDISPISSKNLLVEGTFDRRLIHLLNDKYRAFNDDDFSVISCGGAPEIKKQARFLIQQDLEVLCLYDSDDIGKTQFSDTDPESLIPQKNRKHLKLLDKSFSEFETPEDLFERKAFELAVAKVPELKGFKLSAKKEARMKQVRLFSDQKQYDRNQRFFLKHKLEDELILLLKEDLAKNVLTNTHPLRLFIKAVGEYVATNDT